MIVTYPSCGGLCSLIGRVAGHPDDKVGYKGNDCEHHNTEPHGTTRQTRGVHLVEVLESLHERPVGKKHEPYGQGVFQNNFQ